MIGARRFNTFLLLLTLSAPGIASVICGVNCVQAERRVSAAAAASCHGHAAAGARDVLSGDGVCHERSLDAAIAKIGTHRTLLVAPKRVDDAVTSAGAICPSFSRSRTAPPYPPRPHTPLRI